mgnify:CR=1 FL=1
MNKDNLISHCANCKEDSIAHKIKAYFECRTIQNEMLFNWDDKNKKLLVSKFQLMYLLSLCNDIEIANDYDMELVDKIDIIRI